MPLPSDIELEVIKHAAILRPEPGDIIHVSLNKNTNPASIGGLVEAFRRMAPNSMLLLTEFDVEIKCLDAEEMRRLGYVRFC